MEQGQGIEAALDNANALIGGTRKKKVLLRAPSLTASGYGVHSRQIARWILSKDVDLYCEVLRWGSTTWYIDPKMEDGLVGEIMRYSRKSQSGYDLSIQVQIPNEWDPTLAAVNVGVTAAVETDKCNPKWVEACNKMDLIIVPSQHTKNTIEATGKLTTPIVVVPESFFDDVLDDSIEPLNLELDTSFNFLMVGQLTGNNSATDRKNTFNTLKFLCETFKNDKDVGIILKANSGRNTHIDRKATHNRINAVLHGIRQGSPYPKIHVLHGSMSTKEMAGLYRHPSIKAFVALTRGEGYGLPILEAAAHGLPVIATDWSGHLDFMNKGRFIKVDYDLIELPQERLDNNIFMKGTRWAEPKETSAKKVLKKFRQSSNIPAEWAEKLKVRIREDYSFEAISKYYDTILGEYL